MPSRRGSPRGSTETNQSGRAWVRIAVADASGFVPERASEFCRGKQKTVASTERSLTRVDLVRERRPGPQYQM